MALFESLTKKAADASAKAIQKTREISEVARLNSMISEEEKTISNAYFQIGKLYATVHAQDSEPEFMGMIGTIVDSDRKIQEYKRQIQDLKGVQRCEKCGAEVARGVSFCSSCGAPMPVESPKIPEDKMVCSACGALVKKGMRFCTSCGKPMEQQPSQSLETAQPMENTATERICPACGCKNTSQDAFCKECGAKLG